MSAITTHVPAPMGTYRVHRVVGLSISRFSDAPEADDWVTLLVEVHEADAPEGLSNIFEIQLGRAKTHARLKVPR